MEWYLSDMILTDGEVHDTDRGVHDRVHEDMFGYKSLSCNYGA